MPKKKTQARTGASDRSRDEKRILKGVGVAIEALAAKEKIGLKQLAYEAGVSKGFAYDLARGDGNPSLLLLYRIAKTYGLSLSDLLKDVK